MEEKLVDVKQLIKCFFIYVIYSESYLFKYIPLIILSVFNAYQSDNNISIICTVFSNIILSLVFLKIYWKDLKKEFKIFKKDIFKNLDAGLMLYGIGLAVMVTMNLILVFVFHSEGAKNELSLHVLIKQFPIAMGIIICLFGPFIEEIVFRKTLRDAFPNNAVFIIMSFLVFGSIHVTGTATSLVDWLYIIPYGALGAAFAGMYCKTKTIYTSMTYHMIHNTILFFLVLLT